jgi:serine/threonine-protein kinase
MRSRRPHLPPLCTAAEFLHSLRASGLLPDDLTDRLAEEAGDEPREARAWAGELVERGLLTGYQAEELLAGRGDRLILGKYRILDRLGAGGMGRVYKAEHLLMKRVVALKVIGPAGGSDPGAGAAFQREVEAAAQLDHPHIVTAYDAAEAEGLRFLVMEYVDGIDLERRVRTAGPLPPRVACAYMRQAALALHHAYEQGLLHCDVKPANLLVTGDGEAGVVKVLDLGLARLAAAGPRSEAELAGTPDYLAPEVARDGRRDVRSDLYSLGCTFYFLLTGRAPFAGGSWTEKLLRHQLDEPPALRRVAPHVPPEVARVVERLLSKRPSARYATPRELADALGRLLTVPSASPRPPQPRRLSARGVALAVVFGLAAAWSIRHPEYLYDGSVAPPPMPPVTAATGPAPDRFRLSSTGSEFATLAEAITAARDGDEVVIPAGTHAVEPIDLRGRSLSLRAAAGPRPVLRPERARAWQALLLADRKLTLEGLEIRDEPSGAGPAHLVCVEGAELRLVECRLSARQVAVVCRGSPRVELRGCRIDAGSLAVCLESGSVPSVARLVECTLTSRAAGGTAISAWRPGPGMAASVQIALDDCTTTAARAFALRDLGETVGLAARRCQFTFTESLVAQSGPGRVRWQGAENHYEASGPWLRRDGAPVADWDARAEERPAATEPGTAE